MLAVVLGVLAAVFYGSADFLGGLATKRMPMLAVTVVTQSVGFAVLLVLIPFFPAHPQGPDLAWGLGAGICGAAGIALFYHALAVGKMGVVSPVTAVLGSAFPVTVGIVRGDRLAWFQFAGIGIALFAVVLISLSVEESGEREISTEGLKEAIAAGLFIGGFLLMLAQAHRTAALDVLVAARAGSIGLLLALALAARTKIRPKAGDLAMLVPCGALDMTANVLYVAATFTGELAIAAVLTGLYPASTVLLARVVLDERLRPIQTVGVGLALVGVVLIAA